METKGAYTKEDDVNPIKCFIFAFFITGSIKKSGSVIRIMSRHFAFFIAFWIALIFFLGSLGWGFINILALSGLSILSKIERGQRNATREHVIKLAEYFKVKKDELMVAWLSDKLVYELEDEDLALKAMQFAEEKIKYNIKDKKRK